MVSCGASCFASVRAALVTNVANDHLGEFGIFDLDSAEVNYAKAIGPW